LACRLHSFSASLDFDVDLVSYIASDSGMGYHMSARDILYYIHIFKYISHVASITRRTQRLRG